MTTHIWAQQLKHKELLGRPTGNSITIKTIFDAEVETRIQYGTSPSTYSNQTAWQLTSINGFTDDFAFVTNEVTGLTENTRYYYRVQYRTPGTNTTTNRPEFTFHTARA
jgi:hypothetical protein